MAAKSTRQRRLLGELVEAQRQAVRGGEPGGAARASASPVSLATVYRPLGLLESKQRLRRLDRGRYIACVPGHHHHLVCVSCGAVEETELCTAPPAKEVERRHGFVGGHHEADLYGVCGKCA